MKIPSSIESKLEKRKSQGLFRELLIFPDGIDFYSNDYLGFSRTVLKKNTNTFDSSLSLYSSGATGSRLISGNSFFHEKAELHLADFFNSESALIFNSGYDANIGLLSSIGGRNDIFIIDELCHASIYDGCRLSLSKTYKFKHNDTTDLNYLLEKNKNAENIYVVIESVYSMDGDFAPLLEMTESCRHANVFFIVDEAHATGIIGSEGKGMVHELKLQEKIFARIHTFGKALGLHGACVLGSKQLRDYLVNFARSFIYTTALPSQAIDQVMNALDVLKTTEEIQLLKKNIDFFKKGISENKNWIPSESAIQSIVVSGNENAEKFAAHLMKNNFLVKAIKSPTVASGFERVRICLHSFNTESEINKLLQCIADFT